MTRQLCATVSGSFHRHLGAISAAVDELRGRGVRVLSPLDPRPVDCIDDFILVASDVSKSIARVQGGHLAAIARSNFLWLVLPDGYVGSSAAMEIGYAHGCGVRVLAARTPDDPAVAQYVSVAPSIAVAVDYLSDLAREGGLEPPRPGPIARCSAR